MGYNSVADIIGLSSFVFIRLAVVASQSR